MTCRIYIITTSHKCITFPTNGVTTTPAPITLTGPSVTTTQQITKVTYECTSVFIGRNSIISQWTSHQSIIRMRQWWTRNCNYIITMSILHTNVLLKSLNNKLSNRLTESQVENEKIKTKVISNDGLTAIIVVFVQYLYRCLIAFK